MNNLDQAINIATEVHVGQVDKGGNPYILHPLRVMCTVEKWTRYLSEPEREILLCSAVLHDVFEDYKYNKAWIEKKIKYIFGEIIYDTIDHLTRRESELWKNYINRVREYNFSSTIKIADLEDNCDLERLNRGYPGADNHNLTEKNFSQRNKYLKAIKFLETREGKL